MTQPKCNLCSLRGRTRVNPSGPTCAEYLLIGEAPGQQEAIYGVPFYPMADAGDMLTECCIEAGIDRFLAHITNTCLCHPEGNATPTEEQVLACVNRLFDEIMMCAPKVIVTLGNVPTWALLRMSEKMAGISTYRGKMYQWGPIPVVPTWHPSAVCRDPGKKQQLVDDLKLARIIVED